MSDFSASQASSDNRQPSGGSSGNLDGPAEPKDSGFPPIRFEGDFPWDDPRWQGLRPRLIKRANVIIRDWHYAEDIVQDVEWKLNRLGPQSVQRSLAGLAFDLVNKRA